MLLDYLERTMKWFCGINNIHSVFSLDDATLYDGGGETFAGFIGSITTTYVSVVAPRETVARDGEILLISADYTDSL